jgi:hypothetical protein
MWSRPGISIWPSLVQAKCVERFQSQVQRHHPDHVQHGRRIAVLLVNMSYSVGMSDSRNSSLSTGPKLIASSRAATIASPSPTPARA